MVNATPLATAAGAAAGTLAGAIAGADRGDAAVRRASVRRTATAATAQPPTVPSSLIGFLARKGLAATAGGGIMKARARSAAAVPGYASASRTAPRAASAASASKASSPSSKTTSSSSSLSFLSDPKLSVEEKLMRLMAYLNDKYEKEMQTKMDEIAGKAPKQPSTSKKESGLVGKIAGAVSSVVGGDVLSAVNGFLKYPGVKTTLKSVAGPVLAAGASALGFPVAAPFLLKYGSNAVDAVADVAKAATGSTSSATSGTSGTSTASGTDGKTDQLAMMEIQRLMDKQKEMFSLVSNILRAGHDTRMAAITNMR